MCSANKIVTGNSDQALALGIYGYEFAQAGELMRDYEGWNKEDFQLFKNWMINVWYQFCAKFLRVRNGTWQNDGKWWQAPGHYWSNWGLCNVLAVISIGVLCDDVFIYIRECLSSNMIKLELMKIQEHLFPLKMMG